MVTLNPRPLYERPRYRSARVIANVTTAAVVLGIFAFMAIPAVSLATSWWGSALATITAALRP